VEIEELIGFCQHPDTANGPVGQSYIQTIAGQGLKCVTEAYAHQDLLREAGRGAAGADTQPFVSGDVYFAKYSKSNLQLPGLEVDIEVAKFDLTSLVEDSEAIRGNWNMIQNVRCGDHQRLITIIRRF
jgi:hypothetical protein